MTTIRETRAGRYAGPPGDDTEYWLPRDFDAWDEAWAKHLGGRPEPMTTAERKLAGLSGEGAKREPDMSPEAVAERAEAKRRQAEAVAYVEAYRGTWGLPLDIRANPKWGTKYLKLTEGQVDALLKGRDRDLERAGADAQVRSTPEHQRAEAFVRSRVRSSSTFFQSLNMQLGHKPLTPNQIAAVIRIADEEEARATQREQSPAPQGAGLASQRAPRAPVGSGPEDGMYTVNGEPWKVQWNRTKTGKYAKRLVVAGNGDGVWEYVPGGLAVIARSGQRMTIDEAAAFGKLYGVCAVCGRTLTDETSIAKGIGPICEGKL